MAESFLYAVMIQIGVYLAVMVFIFLALNFMSSGFLKTWFRVKSSRGSLILLKVRTLNQDYFATGWLDNGFLCWKDRKKADRRFALKNENAGAIYRSMGVNVIDVDDEKNGFVLHDWSKVSGFDAEMFEDLYKRALFKPQLMDKNTQLILIGIVVLAVLVAVGFYFSYNWHKEEMQALQALHNIGQPVAEAVITGGA